MTCYELWSIVLNGLLVVIGIITIIVVYLIYKRQTEESLRLIYLPKFNPGKQARYTANEISFPIKFTKNNAYEVKITQVSQKDNFTLNEFRDSVMVEDKEYYFTVNFNSSDIKETIKFNFKITYSDIKKNKYRTYFTYKGKHLQSCYPDYPFD